MIVRAGIKDERTEEMERCIALLLAAKTDEEIDSALDTADEVVRLQFQDLCEEAVAIVSKARQARTNHR